MKNYKIVVMFFLLFPCLLQAHEADPFIDARKLSFAYQSKPLDKYEKVAFIEPYDSAFYITPPDMR